MSESLEEWRRFLFKEVERLESKALQTGKILAMLDDGEAIYVNEREAIQMRAEQASAITRYRRASAVLRAAGASAPEECCRRGSL